MSEVTGSKASGAGTGAEGGAEGGAGGGGAEVLPERLQPIAAVLALLVPGLGQIWLGYTSRGLCIAGGVLGLFFGGLLVGGISVVDSRGEDRIWFLGQSLVGPIALATNAYHQANFKGVDPNRPQAGPVFPGPDQRIEARPLAGGGTGNVLVTGGTPPATRSLGRLAEIGTLLSALAGMLNLIVIIDAAWSCRKSELPG